MKWRRAATKTSQIKDIDIVLLYVFFVINNLCHMCNETCLQNIAEQKKISVIVQRKNEEAEVDAHGCHACVLVTVS